jgi:hypothetical protein
MKIFTADVGLGETMFNCPNSGLRAIPLFIVHNMSGPELLRKSVG